MKKFRNPSFDILDVTDEVGRSYELSCTDSSHTMKIGGQFQFDLERLQYDCDARQIKNTAEIICKMPIIAVASGESLPQRRVLMVLTSVICPAK